MAKISQEEYEVLKEALNEGYEWIARDSHNPLCTHRHKPVKQDHWIQQYWGNVGNGYKEIDDRLFRFIQWEDEEPYSIAELIEEYEKDYKGSWEHAIEFSGEVFGESEETEVKNIEWLKEEIGTEMIQLEPNRKERRSDVKYQTLRNVAQKINQFDEPETLTPEWIDERIHYSTDQDAFGNIVRIEMVPAKYLQNLLVPKQEITYEDAIKVIAENIDTDEFSIGLYLEALSNNEKYEFLTEKWIESNTSPVDDEGRLYVWKRDLQNLIVPKQEEERPETVARVIYEYMKATKRFKEVLGMEVEELDS